MFSLVHARPRKPRMRELEIRIHFAHALKLLRGLFVIVRVKVRNAERQIGVERKRIELFCLLKFRERVVKLAETDQIPPIPLMRRSILGVELDGPP